MPAHHQSIFYMPDVLPDVQSIVKALKASVKKSFAMKLGNKFVKQSHHALKVFVKLVAAWTKSGQ